MHRAKVLFCVALCAHLFRALDAQAGAWTLDPGSIIIRETVYNTKYSFQINDSESSQNLFFDAKIWHMGKKSLSEIEYGYRDDITLFGGMLLSQYADRMSLSYDIVDEAKRRVFSGKEEYTERLEYGLTANMGIRKKLIKKDYDVLSMQMDVRLPEARYVKNIFLNNRSFLLRNSLLYGMSGNIKGFDGWFIDSEVGFGYMPYFKKSLQELNIALGLKITTSVSLVLSSRNKFGAVSWDQTRWRDYSDDRNLILQEVDQIQSGKQYNESKVGLELGYRHTRTAPAVCLKWYSDARKGVKHGTLIFSIEKAF